MEEELTKSKPVYLEDQDDSWEDLTGEFEREKICCIPKDFMKEHSREENCRSIEDYAREFFRVESCSIPEESTKEYSGEEICRTSEELTKEYSGEESCSAPEELTKEYSGEESCSAPDDSTKEYSEEEKENGALRKLPSFEVLTEFPKPDFLKLRGDVFTQQQTTFSFRNMTTSGCSLLGLRRKVHNKTNWLSNSHDNRGKKTTIKIKNSKKHTEVENSKKHKKVKRRDIIASTSGLVLALFATNVLTFVLGCSLGWWSRDAIPTLSIYEFRLDPALM